jgi:hypothetical protein
MYCALGQDRIFEIDESTVTAASAGSLITGEDFAAVHDESDIAALTSHPFFFVKPHITGGNGVNGMVSAHFYLWRIMRKECLRTSYSYVWAWMEDCSTLANNNVSWNNILIWRLR